MGVWKNPPAWQTKQDGNVCLGYILYNQQTVIYTMCLSSLMFAENWFFFFNEIKYWLINI